MRAKVAVVAGLVVIATFAPGLAAREALAQIEKGQPSAAVTLAIIGLGVYDQVHTGFIAAIQGETTPGNGPLLMTYYADLVARGFLDFKNYALPDTFLYASSLTEMDLFAQLKLILGTVPNTTFFHTDSVPDNDATMVTVLTTLKLNVSKPKKDDDDDEGGLLSADTLHVTFIRADNSRIDLTYSERGKANGVTVGKGTFVATAGDGLTTVKLKIQGAVEIDPNTKMRLIRVATNAAERKTYAATGKLVDVVKSEHTGSYTIQDVGAWSYYDGIVANERDSLSNLVTGVCGVTNLCLPVKKLP